MRRSTSMPLLVCLVASLSAAGCDSDPVAAPTPEAPVEISESFSGTLTINGAVTHPFMVQRSGDVIAQLGTLAPDSAAVISISLGTFNGQVCQVILANDSATSAGAVTGTASTAGNFCVRVSDAGRLTAATDYEITVRHF
jgi:hypothetical protein